MYIVYPMSPQFQVQCVEEINWISICASCDIPHTENNANVYFIISVMRHGETDGEVGTIPPLYMYFINFVKFIPFMLLKQALNCKNFWIIKDLVPKSRV